jgi:hypothetical protein
MYNPFDATIMAGVAKALDRCQTLIIYNNPPPGRCVAIEWHQAGARKAGLPSTGGYGGVFEQSVGCGRKIRPTPPGVV